MARDLYDLALSSHPSEVPFGIVAETNVANNLVAIQMLHAFAQMNMQMTPRVIVVHVFLDAHVQTTNRIDNVFGRVKPQDHIIIEGGTPSVLEPLFPSAAGPPSPYASLILP